MLCSIISYMDIPSSDQIIETIMRETDTVLLAFSCGKDSISAWLHLRPHFNVIPFYMYLVPDLEFVEKSLLYYESFFSTRIMRVPHPSLYRMLNALVFQPPERYPVIKSLGLPNFDYNDLHESIREDLSRPGCFVATGVRAADSPERLSAVKTHGPISQSKRQFWAIWDWKIARVVETLKSSGIQLPIDYDLFGRTFDGLDARFTSVIKDRLPNDYKTILEWFPFVELELMRKDLRHVR